MISWVFLGLRRGHGSIARLGRLWGCDLGGCMGMLDCLILYGRGRWRGLRLRYLLGHLGVLGGTSQRCRTVSLNEFGVDRLRRGYVN